MATDIDHNWNRIATTEALNAASIDPLKMTLRLTDEDLKMHQALQEQLHSLETIPKFKVLNKIQVYKYKYDNAKSEIEATQYAAIITVLESLI